MYPIYTMSRVLRVSASGFYAWMIRSPSKHAQHDVVLGDRIEAISRRSRSTYGRPRIHAELVDEGIRIGGKRVARLMRIRSICETSRRKTTITTIRDRDAKPAPDLVERRFTADAPNQLWVADIAYVPTWSGFLYLAVVLDECSRRVVGWAMADHMRKELVIDALDMAIYRRKPLAVVHHSIKARSTRQLLLGNAARPQVSGHRWVPTAIVTITQCARASTPHSNASCSSSIVFEQNEKRKPPSSTTSRRGTIHMAVIRRSAISHRPTTSAEHKRWLEIQLKYYPRNRVNISMSRNRPMLLKNA